MKKLTTLAKMLGVFLLGSASLTASAYDPTPLQLGVKQTLQPNGANAFSYSPTTDGVLTIKFEEAGSGQVVYTTWNVDEASDFVSETTITEYYEYSYKLYQNETYYIWEYLYNSTRSFTATFVASTGGNDGPEFESLQEVPWQMSSDAQGTDNRYTGFTWVTNDPSGIKGPSTCLYYTPESNGILTVYLSNIDPHLYNRPWDKTANFQAYTNGFIQCGLPSGSTAPHAFVYEVIKGQTYYLYAQQEASDNLSYAYATFQASTINYKQIKENEQFTSYDEVMLYTPKADGMLTITANCSWQYNWTEINGAGLIFSDLGHQTKILLESPQQGNPEISPSEYNLAVKGGETYYLFNSTVPNCQFTFSWKEMGEVALVKVTPEPGKAYDFEGDYATGTYLTFSPQNVKFQTATVTYTPAGETDQTTVTLDPNAGVGENSDFEFENGSWKFRAVSKYYKLSAKGTYTTLTIKGANYDGIAVTENASGYQSVSVNDGTITASWFKPDTPVEIVSESWPTVIYNNSTKGDPRMMATVTFNEAITSVPSASMVFGSQTYGAGSSGDSTDPGRDLPSYVSGNTITIDMSGIDFGALMATHETGRQYSTITVFVGNIFGASGQKFLAQNPGIAEFITYNNSEQAPALSYMNSTPTMVYNDENAAAPFVTIYWDEAISPVVEGQTLTGMLTTPNGQQAGLELSLTSYGNFEGYNALVGNLASIIQTYGAGDYTLSIGTIVMNKAGEVNKTFEDDFTVEVMITLSDIEPTISYSADQIIVNWNKMPLTLYNPGNDYIYISNEDESKVYELSIANNFVSLVNNNVVIYIQNLDLVDEGVYTLFIPAYYFYIGEGLECNDEVEDTFTYSSSKVNRLISDDMMKEGIYNLQGMKVNADNLQNGIYIINGKKVVIRK